MAIEFVHITGKTSVASAFLVIEDNFNLTKETINDLLSIVDIGTGKFDNSTFGTDNNIETLNVKSKGTSGIEITLGNLNLTVGKVIMSGSSSRIEIGTNVKFERITKNLTLGTIDIIDFSGTSGALTGNGPVGGFVLPRLSNATIVDIVNPNQGLIVFDTTTTKFKGYDGTAWVDLN